MVEYWLKSIETGLKTAGYGNFSRYALTVLIQLWYIHGPASWCWSDF
jgi:hypothetical protein